MKKWSGDISKLYLHTEFHENRPICLVSSDGHRHTHIRTDIFLNPFLDSGDLKMDISTKISKSNFFTITILSPYILYMGESNNIKCIESFRKFQTGMELFIFFRLLQHLGIFVGRHGLKKQLD